MKEGHSFGSNIGTTISYPSYRGMCLSQIIIMIRNKSMNNKKQESHEPVFTTNHYSREIVHIPLSNSLEPAVVDQSDYDRLIAAGLSNQWTWNEFRRGYRKYGYVRCRVSQTKGEKVSLARLIARAKPGMIVKYRDGNPKNLCRNNLVLKKGNAKGMTLCQKKSQ